MFLFFFCRDSGELLSLHPEFTALAELTGGVVVADYYCRCCFLPRVACRTASLAGPQDRQRLPQLEAGVRGTAGPEPHHQLQPRRGAVLPEQLQRDVRLSPRDCSVCLAAGFVSCLMPMEGQSISLSRNGDNRARNCLPPCS